MFILDSLLVESLRFVLDKIVAAAEAEMQDDTALREQLLEAQMRLELGEISSQSGPTYFARVQYGRLVEGALQARSERYVADILDQLREVSVASRINKPIGDKMIMNAAFLISRDQEQAFDAKVKSIASRFDKLTFKYTAPCI